MSGSSIVEIETWACNVPLAQPIDLGNFILRQRSHLAVRVRTQGGLVAECVTQTRGSPLDVVVAEVIAPRLVGKDALDVTARRDELKLELTAMEFDGAIGRAWSAVEICLQSLRAQDAGLPLWRLLGGRERRLPVEIVEGYGLIGESDEAFAERLAARVAEGFQMIKIEAAHYRDVDQLCRQLTAFRKLAGDGPQLILDFAWSWKNAEQNRELVTRVENLGIAWIEDAFPRERLDDYLALKAFARVPIGCGDESTRPSDLAALVRAGAIDVLRLDATTLGGVEPLRALASQAKEAGVRVSFHEHAEVHEHCVLGLDAADHIEIFPTDRHFDCVHQLIEESTYDRVSGGFLTPYEKPGIGMKLRSDGLAKFARRHNSIKN